MKIGRDLRKNQSHRKYFNLDQNCGGTIEYILEVFQDLMSQNKWEKSEIEVL